MPFPACLRPAFAPLAALAFLAGCASAPAPLVEPPKLVVILVVDGLPQRQVTGHRGQLGADGLNRFLERGTWFANAHYGHANTLTGPGHATILTGATPRRTGIIANDWRDPATGEAMYCAEDAAHGYLGHRTGRFSGTSPRNLKAESLGDVLRRADARSKVIAVSGKDRGAILPAGRDGTAYVYMPQTGTFDSTTYYMARLPAWLGAFNGAKPADRYFRAKWSPLLPEMAYARSVPDGQPWFAPGGKLPMVMGAGHDAPGPGFYGELFRSPFLDALLLDFARAAIDGEALGRDEAPDLLVVSLSSHDYVNHSWGPESRLSHDHVLQLDHLLAAFFRHLDRKLGKDGYLAVLTADHGFMPAPEFLLREGKEAGRLDAGRMLARLEAGLAAAHGEGPWTKGWSAQGIVLDRDLAGRRGVGAASLQKSAKSLILAEPSVAAAYTRAELEDAATPDAPWLEATRRSWRADLSADLQVVLEPGFVFSTWTTGTTHGSPHAYDTHVPILVYGPKWARATRVEARADVVDIAPTLARLLGIAAPAAAEGRALPVAP